MRSSIKQLQPHCQCPALDFFCPFSADLLLLSPSCPGAWGTLRTPVQLEMAKLLKTLLWVTLALETRPSFPAASPLRSGVCLGADGLSRALRPFRRQRRGSFTSSKMGTWNGVMCPGRDCHFASTVKEIRRDDCLGCKFLPCVWIRWD